MRTKIAALGLVWVALSSCAGMKVQKGAPEQPPPSKPGVTLGGSFLSGGGVQKVGYWCDVKGGVLTFGAFGETEASATESAKSNCRKTVSNKPCELVACKKQ